MSEDDQDEFGREGREASWAVLIGVHLGGSLTRGRVLKGALCMQSNLAAKESGGSA